MTKFFTELLWLNFCYLHCVTKIGWQFLIKLCDWICNYNLVNKFFKSIVLWNSNSDSNSDNINSDSSYTEGSNIDKSNTDSSNSE